MLSFVSSDVRLGVNVGRELWFASGFRSVIIAWEILREIGEIRGYRGLVCPSVGGFHWRTVVWGPEFAYLWRFRGMAESLCAGVNRRVTAPPPVLII